MDAEPALRRAIGVEIGPAQHAHLLQDHVLDHATMTLRHEEGVRRGALAVIAHEAVIDTIDDLGAGISRADMQCRDLLRDVENPAAIGATPLARAYRVKTVALRMAHSMIVQ